MAIASLQQCLSSESKVANLELGLKEQLNLKSELSYSIRKDFTKDFIVSLAADQFNLYMPPFSCQHESLDEAKQRVLQKAAVFVELANQIKNTRDGMGERLGVYFCEIYQKMLHHLGLEQDSNSAAKHEPASCNGQVPFANWFGKQKAKFRIKKNEKLKTKELLSGYYAPIPSSQPSVKNEAVENIEVKPCSLLEQLQNEPPDVRIFRVCETLDLQAPSFVYEERRVEDGRCEIKCILTFMGHTFSISRIGSKRIAVKELAAEQALEALRDKIATLEYQKIQLQELKDTNQEKKSKRSVHKEYAPAAVGTLVSIDVEKINTPFWEVMDDSKAEGDTIPANIIGLLGQFASRKKLQSPRYHISQVGFYFSGTAAFAGYEFDLQGRTFSTKKETKAQLAFLIWKSLKEICTEGELLFDAKKPCIKPNFPSSESDCSPSTAPSSKYTLKPSLDRFNSKNNFHSGKFAARSNTRNGSFPPKLNNRFPLQNEPLILNNSSNQFHIFNPHNSPSPQFPSNRLSTYPVQQRGIPQHQHFIHNFPPLIHGNMIRPHNAFHPPRRGNQDRNFSNRVAPQFPLPPHFHHPNHTSPLPGMMQPMMNMPNARHAAFANPSFYDIPNRATPNRPFPGFRGFNQRR